MEQKKTNSFTSTLIWIEENIMALVVLGVTVLLFVNVILRYMAPHMPEGFPTISWAEEAIRYGIIWITFLAAANAFRRESHFGVDLIYRVKSPAFGKFIRMFNDVGCFVFCGFVFYYGLQMVLFNVSGGQVSPALKLPFWLVYSVIPFSGALSMLYIARNFVIKIKTPAEVLYKHNNTSVEGVDEA